MCCYFSSRVYLTINAKQVIYSKQTRDSTNRQALITDTKTLLLRIKLNKTFENGLVRWSILRQNL